MKKSRILALCLLAGILIVAVVSCDLLAMTISGRISAFETSLNASSRNLIQHFHPNMSGRALWAVDSAFNTTELAASYAPFSIYAIGSETDIGGGYRAVNAMISNSGGGAGAQTIYFEFLEDGVDNWKISYMDIAGGAGGSWGS
jgi:hypothetical protein